MPTITDVAAAAERAAARIGTLVVRTPLVLSRAFSEKTGANVYCKLENLQHTGAFKARGALNKLLTLSAEERAKGCVTASSGNHGAAVAFAMQELNTSGVIFVPEQTSTAKIDTIRRYGGEVRFFGNDGLQTEMHARKFAAQHDMVYVPPYNDFEVIAGQATCGLEIASQLAEVDVAFIAVGGGGLLSGVGSVLRTCNPDVRIIGCQPEASAVMARSVAAGEILELPSDPTLSDGTAGGIEADTMTFELCRQIVDEFVLVSEDHIADAMRQFIDAEKQLIEGAAGVALAALLQRADAVSGTNVVVIICGGNISHETLKSIT